jgi:hypothetical protein
VSSQGYAGGLGYTRDETSDGRYPGSGGGGGAGAVGRTTFQAAAWGYLRGGDGGAGVQSAITGTLTFRAGGGGGHTAYAPNGGGSGGNGGGGYGGVSGNNSESPYPAAPGTTNTGGGGGGGGYDGEGILPGAGGSGVVIISCPAPAASTTGSPTVSTVSGRTVYVFTGSGSITF